jgi:hypothetical protein
MEPPVAVLIIIVAFVGLALLNRATEETRRLRCGARLGLFRTCMEPVNDRAVRCRRHTGLPKRLYP